MRIGVDVGGTNTDAVLMQENKVLASHKAPTTENVSDGIVSAINAVLSGSGVAAAQIQHVMIGTTHFTNAFVERKGLLSVGIIRIALPSSRGVLPLTDWPVDLSRTVGKHHFLIKGGYQYDGRIADELDEVAVANAAKEIRRKGLKTVAITGLFSPVNSAMEYRALEIVQNELPDASITLSSNIGRVGILERENAAVMNASLADLSRTVVQSFHDALRKLKIDAPFYVSQNDGTLMSSAYVEKYPVLTFASGPTNSMRGAAYLSGLKNALIADIGGTTTDIGVLVNGFPRESSITVDIGGVRTNFRMPDVLSLGLGGGSLVETRAGRTMVGPTSIGYRLLKEAMVFGGQTMCATDLAVAGGYSDIGDKNLVSKLPRELVSQGIKRIHEIVTEGVDRMKTSFEPVPLVLVGGGSVLIRDDIPGTSETIIPDNAGVANAIGASIAQVSGETDRVFAYDAMGREASLQTAKDEAKARAVDAGADPTTIEVLDIEEVPLAYMPGGAVRIRVKVAGELAATR
ncbi:MAG: hydantoinase/oxoprolinase family protein [Gammaproteobacteria bacterium]|nr:hydantoinase/oxoprolinase family protein [Gammaproteobacteria bacterium]